MTATMSAAREALMDWKRISIATLAGALAATVLLPAAPARATGDNAGALGSGGVATGDISNDPGETDRVTVELGYGSNLEVSFTAGFPAQLELTDPDGAPVDLGFVAGQSTLKRVRLAVTRPGTYAFAVSSADGTQGTYRLTAKQKWPKSFPVAGSGQATIDIGMPTAGKVSAVVRRTQGAPGQPRILSLVDPGDNSLLTHVIEAKKDTAKLPSVVTSLAGTYHLTITATDNASDWTGQVHRSVRSIRPASLRLSNGLDQVSFSQDGVDEVFRRQCAGCHFWASGYAGSRSYAKAAVARMRSGNMPPGGRVPKAQIDLVQSWITTKYGR